MRNVRCTFGAHFGMTFERFSVSRFRACRVPMSKAVNRQMGVLGINQLNGIVRVSPGVNEIFAREGFADVFGSAGIVDDDIALFGKADADDEMAIWARSLAAKAVIANGKADGQT